MVTGKPCLQCGKPLERRWNHELRKAVFCGNQCKFAYQSVHPTNFRGTQQSKNCVHCGKLFFYYASVRPTAQYCCYACKAAEHGSKVSVAKAGKWVGSKRGKVSARKLAKKYLLQRCALCGWKEASCDAHHIIDLRRGGPNHLGNIIILCPNHHRMADEELISQETLLKCWHQTYDELHLDEALLH